MKYNTFTNCKRCGAEVKVVLDHENTTHDAGGHALTKFHKDNNVIYAELKCSNCEAKNELTLKPEAH